jgi:hypothetical protein
MKKEFLKINLKQIFVLVVIYLICCQNGASQPSCFSSFDPFLICNSEYHNKEFVFIGRVIFIEEKPNYSPKIPIRIIVEVETLIKGKLERQIEIFLDQSCDTYVGVNQEYIFTANKETRGNSTRLFSNKWSYEIQEYSKQEKAEVVTKIQSLIKNIKQPRIIGKVVQHFGNKNISFAIRINSVNNKLGYDPQYTKPLANVVLVAKLKTGKRFKTKTNAYGEYEFENLPSGEYEVFTNLPKEFTVTPYGDTHIMSNERKAYIKIDDGICSKKVIFATQVLGSLNGRIVSTNENWSVYSGLSLTRIESISGRRDIFESDFYPYTNASYSKNGSEIVVDFLISGIPIGKYIVYIQSKNNLGVHYPGVNDRDKAEVIEITAGKPNNFVFRLQ